MSGNDQEESAAIAAEAARFRAGFRTVVLATAGADGVPEASYAPYVTDAAGQFFVYVSGLARHTRNLAATGQVDLLFLQEEAATANPFARVRLGYACRAEAVAHGSEPWTQTLDHFEREFGNIVAVLRTLPDFRLFRLIPLSARYVRGFGQAYVFEGEALSAVRVVGPRTPGGTG